MPTTFDAVYLGVLPDLDTVEGNTDAENASVLLGMTFGGLGDPLVNDFVSISPVGDPGNNYNLDNNPDEFFAVDGGAGQTFDGSAAYDATVTYVDGTTSNISAVIFQDVAGNTYWAPEFSPNADQTAIEAGAIRSITLNSVVVAENSGLRTDRETWDFVTCFVRGTEIEAERGLVKVENLQIGDLVLTADSGLQPLRWIGRRQVPARGSMAPIRIQSGALGNDKDILVSGEHRVLITDWRTQLLLGMDEVLIAAKHLINGDTVHRVRGGKVEYFHIMFDKHELVQSAGIWTESFNPTERVLNSIEQAVKDEILTFFPELNEFGPGAFGPTARTIARGYEARLISNKLRRFYHPTNPPL